MSTRRPRTTTDVSGPGFPATCPGSGTQVGTDGGDRPNLDRMTGPDSYTAWLGGRSDAQLVALLERRPDLAVPLPASMAVLATRAEQRASVLRAADDLDTAAFGIVEALAVHTAAGNEPPTRTELKRALRGRAKAALVAVEFDEFGGGHGDRIHARLYADLLRGAGLDDGYLHYLDVVPAPMLTLVDMMSLFGLHRSLRGALVGHFAAVEISSSPASRVMVEALQRFSAHPDCVRFYAEHVPADAVHEQVVRRDVLADLLAREPELAESVVFGIQATELLETRCTESVLGCWRAGDSSLRPEAG